MTDVIGMVERSQETSIRPNTDPSTLSQKGFTEEEETVLEKRRKGKDNNQKKLVRKTMKRD